MFRFFFLFSFGVPWLGSTILFWGGRGQYVVCWVSLGTLCASEWLVCPEMIYLPAHRPPLQGASAPSVISLLSFLREGSALTCAG